MRNVEQLKNEIGYCSKPITSNIINGDVIEGDVIEVASNIKNKFDVIIADPPYNIGKDFGNNKTKKEIEEYVIWCKEWIEICIELLSNDGLIYIYGFPEILARISSKCPIDKQRILAWHYTNKTTPFSTFWQRSYESILCLWKDQKPKLSIEQIREPYTNTFKKLNGKIRKGTKGRFSNGKETLYNVHENGALPRDVIKIPALAGGAGSLERYFICNTCNGNIYTSGKLKEHEKHDILKHPTQKPMKLTERLIKSIIQGQNGKVLIPFSGSGSECVVAKKLGVEFLGIEINPEYVKLSKKWLDHV